MEISLSPTDQGLFTAVYGSQIESFRDGLWDELSTFILNNTRPWLLASDFNDTKSLEERMHCGQGLARRCTKFNHWIKNNGLIDLGFSGPRYTWCRGRDNRTRKYARVDRGLCNLAWRERFEEAGVRHLIQHQSDHCPLLISPFGFTNLASGPKPFRFQAAWISHDQFAHFLFILP